MSKDSASGFVQDEPAQFAVIGDEVSLLPQRLARWNRNATDDHISDFAFGVATNDMDNLTLATLVVITKGSPDLHYVQGDDEGIT